MESRSVATGAGERPRFNGATAMRPWKATIAMIDFDNAASLQWGHGDEAVERVVS